MSDEMSDAHLQARQDRQVADPPPNEQQEDRWMSDKDSVIMEKNAEIDALHLEVEFLKRDLERANKTIKLLTEIITRI